MQLEKQENIYFNFDGDKAMNITIVCGYFLDIPVQIKLAKQKFHVDL